MSYTESDEYQNEITAQYKSRKLQLSVRKVVEILKVLDFETKEADVKVVHTGNLQATYVTPDLVIKISDEENAIVYAANTIVSIEIPEEKTVSVLKHDVRQKTDYEVLIMERSPGTLWLNDVTMMTEKANKNLCRQILDVARASHKVINADVFGWVGEVNYDPKRFGYKTYTEQLTAEINTYSQELQNQTHLDQNLIAEILIYVRDRLRLFDNDKPYFIHGDLHMGNVIHENGDLTAVLDWDTARYAPLYVELITLIGLIDNPAQFVEGTKDFAAYKGRKFEYLYPELKAAFVNELADPKLPEKLNVLGIIEGLMWVSEDWSKEWNKEMIANLSTVETPENSDVSETYYGKIIQKLKAA